MTDAPATFPTRKSGRYAIRSWGAAAGLAFLASTGVWAAASASADTPTPPVATNTPAPSPTTPADTSTRATPSSSPSTSPGIDPANVPHTDPIPKTETPQGQPTTVGHSDHVGGAIATAAFILSGVLLLIRAHRRDPEYVERARQGHPAIAAKEAAAREAITRREDASRPSIAAPTNAPSGD